MDRTPTIKAEVPTTLTANLSSLNLWENTALTKRMRIFYLFFLFDTLHPSQFCQDGLPGSIVFVGKASKTFQQTTKADDFCCEWRFKN